MKPWLWIPPDWAHDISTWAMKMVSWVYEDQPIPQWQSKTWRGLHFPNPLGLAGGVDKDGENILDWWRMGCGFLEIGTVTPRPQDPNPGKIIDRDCAKQALWNRMGFPSLGASEVYYNLRRHGPPFRTPLFVNLGKNRDTPNSLAFEDYRDGLSVFESLAQVFVINISSPNTQGLRDLQKPESLKGLLGPLKDYVYARNNQPLLVKLSPDSQEEDFLNCVETCLALGVDGFVLTNTTLDRVLTPDFPKEGGVSGAPLKERSEACLQTLINILGKKKKDLLVVSVGGVSTPKDVFHRLDLGADLVQVYSTLVFNGPLFFRETHKQWQMNL